jgi:hypothetical protein
LPLQNGLTKTNEHKERRITALMEKDVETKKDGPESFCYLSGSVDENPHRAWSERGSVHIRAVSSEAHFLDDTPTEKAVFTNKEPEPNMGIYLSTYGIKIDEITAILGSADKKIYTKYKKNLTPYDPYPDDSELSAEEALKTLIYNPAEIKPHPVFLFVLWQICGSLTKTLPNSINIKLGPDTERINYYLQTDFHKRIYIETLLIKDAINALHIPQLTGPIYDDLDIDPYECPLMSITPHQTLQKTKNKFKNIVITDDEIKKKFATVGAEENIKGYYYRYIKWLLENIDYCITQTLDLIIFCG